MIYKNDKVFGSYLAGLWEGDGSIAIKKGYTKPTFIITFNSKDLPLAEKLLHIITSKSGSSCLFPPSLWEGKGGKRLLSGGKGKKTGSIWYQKHRNACYLSIYSVQGLKYVVGIIRGNLRTPKAYQIDQVIDWLNKKHNAGITKLPISKVKLSKNAWLSGFIDADGSFNVRQTLPSSLWRGSKTKAIETTKTKKQIECKFILTQRMVYPKTNKSYGTILNLIAEFLCVKLNLQTVKNPKIRDQYRVISSSAKSKAILRIYLDKYPLLTSKLSDYTAWCLVDNLMIKKQHYTVQGILEVSKLKNSMNNNRTTFNWYHLDKL